MNKSDNTSLPPDSINRHYARILVFCNPILDILASPPPELLHKYGLNPNDAILSNSETLPLFDEISQYNPQYFAGGSGQNTVRGAQWILTAQNRPNCTTYFGTVGSDREAKQLLEAQQAAGVETLYDTHPTLSTGRCLCLLTGADRSMVAHLAAAATIQAPYPFNQKYFVTPNRDTILYLTAYLLDIKPTPIPQLRALDFTLAFNLAAPVLCVNPEVRKTIEYTQFLFGNDSEAVAAVGQPGKTVEECARILYDLPRQFEGDRTVIITCGHEDTLVVSHNSAKYFPVIAISKEEIAGATGAGDAFVAGFLSQVMQGAPLAFCVHMGHYAACEVLKVVGCRYPTSAPSLCT